MAEKVQMARAWRAREAWRRSQRGRGHSSLGRGMMRWLGLRGGGGSVGLLLTRVSFHFFGLISHLCVVEGAE